jgi:tripartite-type tricarboxylate transporter receptor subunit TctC
MIVPYPPGGSADILARLLGDKLQPRLGQPIIVENRPGGGSIVGARSVVNAAPDGYTLLLGTVSSHAMTPAVNKTAGYDPVEDFTPVARLASMPFVLLVRPGLGVKSMQDLIARAKENPSALTYGSAGIGTSNHMAGELFNSQAGTDMVHVPYRGSAPAMNALLAGEVDMMFDLVMTAAPHIKAGTVVALGTTGAKRSKFLPELPTLAEQGLDDYQVTAWFGLFGPDKLPKPIVEKLNVATNTILARADIQKRLGQLGVEPEMESADAFGRFVQAESLKWKMTVRKSHIAAGD